MTRPEVMKELYERGIDLLYGGSIDYPIAASFNRPGCNAICFVDDNWRLISKINVFEWKAFKAWMNEQKG